MKYKNKTDRVLKFRANDKNGKKRVFELESGKTMESDREVIYPGLELIEEKEKNNKKGDK